MPKFTIKVVRTELTSYDQVFVIEAESEDEAKRLIENEEVAPDQESKAYSEFHSRDYESIEVTG